MKQKEFKIAVQNPHAAGIDIGSRKHVVAVGNEMKDVYEFRISHSEHIRLIALL
jgi:hypothetical protein